MSRPLEILLVEDNEGDVKIILSALCDVTPNCTVSVANDGVEALAFLRDRKDGPHTPSIDIILLDLNMPRMGGLECLKVIKSDSQLRAIPVIILTSSQSRSDIKNCYAAYASCYVVKPFDGKQFIATVREIVDFWSQLARLPV